jgi:hypothetical protein
MIYYVQITFFLETFGIKSKHNDDKYSAGKRKENIHKNGAQSILPRKKTSHTLFKFDKLAK